MSNIQDVRNFDVLSKGYWFSSEQLKLHGEKIIADYKTSEEYAKDINEAFNKGIEVGKRELMQIAIEKDIRAKVIDEINTQITLLKNGECNSNCQCSDDQEECPYLQAIHDVEFYIEQLKEQNNEQ